MSLLDNILPKKENWELILILALDDHRIQAATIRIDDEKVTVLGKGDSDYSQTGNETEAADMAISMSEKDLPEGKISEKVIFAIPQRYLDAESIEKNYQSKLKNIAKELNLKPVGFIDYASAVSLYLEKSEGSPPTILLMGLSKNDISFSLIRVGKIQQNIKVPRTDSVIADFETALPKFSSEILPSKIIIYNHHDKTEDIREEMLRFHWHKHSNFLHTPKIEIFPVEKILSAIIEAAGSTISINLKAIDPDTSNESEIDQSLETDGKTINADPPHEKSSETEIPKEENAKKNAEFITEEIQDDNFGFVTEDLDEELDTNSKNEAQSDKKFSLAKGFGIFEKQLSKIKSTFSDVIKKSKDSKNDGRNSKFILIFGVLFIFISLCVIGYLTVYFIPHAKIHLIAYPQKNEETISVTFTKNSEMLEDKKNFIMLNMLEEEVTGEKSTVTTGKTKIGDKAKGEITIYNKTLSGKTFTKGSILTSSGLSFNLDENVSIASASDTGEGLKYGKANVKVTASVIGPEGNIEASSNFSFKDLPESSYSAKNAAPFTGGSSREIPSVSKEDKNKLETELTKELTKKAKENINARLDFDEKIFDEPAVVNVKDAKFSAETGNEAKELSLNMALTVGYLTYRLKNLEELAKNNNSQAPPGFKIDENATLIKINQISKEKNGDYSAKAVITSIFIPEFDTDLLKTKIAGKKFEDASAYLQTIDHVAGVKIITNNILPIFKNTLPFLPKNIELKTTTN